MPNLLKAHLNVYCLVARFRAGLASTNGSQVCRCVMCCLSVQLHAETVLPTFGGSAPSNVPTVQKSPVELQRRKTFQPISCFTEHETFFAYFFFFRLDIVRKLKARRQEITVRREAGRTETTAAVGSICRQILKVTAKPRQRRRPFRKCAKPHAVSV